MHMAGGGGCLSVCVYTHTRVHKEEKGIWYLEKEKEQKAW